MRKQISKSEMNKNAKKKAIFKSAIDNFARNGFYETKMSDIARDANVADGTLYLYFANKDDLLIKVFEEMVDEKLEQIKECIKNETNALAKLYKMFEYHVDLFTNNPSYVRFFVQEIRQSPDFYKRYPDFQPIKKYLLFIEELIQEAIDSGLVRPLDTKIATRLIYGSIDFILSEWALTNDATPLHDIHKVVIDILHNGMRS